MGLRDWFRRKSDHESPTLDQFADRLIAAIHQRGFKGTVARVEPQRLRFHDPGDSAVFELYLGNAYDEYIAANLEERRAVLARYARLRDLRTRARNPLDARGASDLALRILPKLTPRRDDEAMRLRARPLGLAGVIEGRLIGESLRLELAVEHPESIQVILMSDLDAAGLSEGAAFEHAVANLRARSAGPWNKIAPGLLQSPWADYFDGARLACPELFSKLGLRGDPIVVVPNRCAALATGSEEREGLAALYGAATALMQEDRPVELTPLRLVGGAWSPLGDADVAFLREAQTALFLSSIQAALDYELLQELLTPVLRERDLALTPLRAIKNESGLVTTVTELPTKPKVAIPRADLFEYVHHRQRRAVAWYKLEALLGPDLVPVAGIWPPYFAPTRAVTGDEIAAVELAFKLLEAQART